MPQYVRPNWRGWLLAICISSGCGGEVSQTAEPLGKVTGVVTFQNMPVSTGQVRFKGVENGVDLLVKIESEGKFEVQTAKGPGLTPGEYQLAIVPPIPEAPLGPPPPDYREPEYPFIPQKYRDISTSQLRTTVQPGNNRLQIDMQP